MAIDPPRSVRRGESRALQAVRGRPPAARSTIIAKRTSHALRRRASNRFCKSANSGTASARRLERAARIRSSAASIRRCRMPWRVICSSNQGSRFGIEYIRGIDPADMGFCAFCLPAAFTAARSEGTEFGGEAVNLISAEEVTGRR